MVELRKRKTPPPAPVRPTKQKKAAPKGKVAQAKEAVVEKVEAVKEAVTGKSNGEEPVEAPPAAVGGIPKVGDTIDLAGFGGEVETHEGTKTSLAKLVEGEALVLERAQQLQARLAIVGPVEQALSLEVDSHAHMVP